MSIETIIANAEKWWAENADRLHGLECENCFGIEDAFMRGVNFAADQLSACRTAEAVAWQYRVRFNVDGREVIGKWKHCDKEEADYYAEHLPHSNETRALYAHPAKAVPEGEAAYKVFRPDGSLYADCSSIEAAQHFCIEGYRIEAHPAPVASRVTVDEAMMRIALEAFWRGYNKGLPTGRGYNPARRAGRTYAGILAALEAALTTPERG